MPKRNLTWITMIGKKVIMDQEEKKMIEIENGGVSKKIDAITFVSLMDLIPNSIYKKLDGQEVVELLEIFRKQKQNGKDERNSRAFV